MGVVCAWFQLCHNISFFTQIIYWKAEPNQPRRRAF
jgi:hypothetical protein